MIIQGVVTMLLLDFIWLTLNAQTYDTLVKSVQNNKLSFKLSGAIVAYIAMIIGFIFFVLPLATQDKSENNIMKAIKYGGLFGFVVYAIFNATNYAIFDNYVLSTALLDTYWGICVYSMATYVALLNQ